MSIEILLNPIDGDKRISSHSMDYINANEEEYNKLLSIGEPLIKYIMEKFDKTSTNGLEEAIMAQLCIDYIGGKAAEIEWLTGRDWFEKYKNI